MHTQGWSALPRIVVGAGADTVVEKLRTASKRGRLAGFTAPSQGGALFSVAAHGRPFDGVLAGWLNDGRLEFRLNMHRRLPVIFAVVLLATVWPGVYFMDELIAVFLPSLWRPWVTYYWYLPLTVLPLPWVWVGLMRRSRATIHASALEAIGKIAAETGGKVETQPMPR
ncbi:MAG: hypothetical protein KF678_09845 [Phycisphaeraceae bacterium]|nr:hypothetical protein [Phycisphaeraceae bacterium]